MYRHAYIRTCMHGRRCTYVWFVIPTSDILPNVSYTISPASNLFPTGVYTNDELPSYGINLRINEKEDTSYYSPSIFLPPSPCQSAGVFPILFSSSTSLYPSADDYTWRVRTYVCMFVRMYFSAFLCFGISNICSSSFFSFFAWSYVLKCTVRQYKNIKN